MWKGYAKEPEKNEDFSVIPGEMRNLIIGLLQRPQGDLAERMYNPKRVLRIEIELITID